MNESRMKIAFIIPTKDRPEDLRKMLRSLAAQTRRADQVIVVDASGEPAETVVRSVGGLSVDYLRWQEKPSAAAQRNGGLALVRGDMDLVCFFDDDQILHPDALEKMLAFWETVGADVGGASFNMANHEDCRRGRLKKSRWSDALGLYCSEPGRVARSGWQSLYGRVTQNTEVEWMGSGASVWRKQVLDDFQFDPFFEGYSYLEDVDFSYSISRKYRLIVVADALFEHYPRYSQRSDNYRFGCVETINRLYLVRKHRLSVPRCYLGLLIRWAMTLRDAIIRCDGKALQRLLGNLAGIATVRVM
jgi:glycosyltransferase involved in cell wall biosynthesis